MASSTNIQNIARSAAGSSGISTEEFPFEGAVVAGDVVCYDNSQTGDDRVKVVKACATAALDRAFVVGVAMESTADLPEGKQTIKVCVAGGPVQAKSVAGISAGDVLHASAATASAVADAGVAVIAIAVDDVDGGFAPVCVVRRFI